MTENMTSASSATAPSGTVNAPTADETIRDLEWQARAAVDRMSANNPHRAVLMKVTSMMLSLEQFGVMVTKRLKELEVAQAEKPRIILP